MKSDILKEKERERGCHNFFPLRQNRQHDDVTFVPTITKNVTFLPLTIKYDVTFVPSTIKYDMTFIPSTIKYDVTFVPTITKNVTFLPSTYSTM